jgi:hypothetical protein
MKIIVVIQRIMLGSIFLESGINGFVLHSPAFGTRIGPSVFASQCRSDCAQDV